MRFQKLPQRRNPPLKNMAEENLEQKNSNSNPTKFFFLLFLIALFFVLIGIWSWWQKATKTIRERRFEPVFVPTTTVLPSPSPILERKTSDDRTTEIEKDLNDFNLPSLDQEFKEIDQDLNSL